MLKCRYCNQDYFAYKIYWWDEDGKEQVFYKCEMCEDHQSGKELQERLAWFKERRNNKQS